MVDSYQIVNNRFRARAFYTSEQFASIYRFTTTWKIVENKETRNLTNQRSVSLMTPYQRNCTRFDISLYLYILPHQYLPQPMTRSRTFMSIFVSQIRHDKASKPNSKTLFIRINCPYLGTTISYIQAKLSYQANVVMT